MSPTRISDERLAELIAEIQDEDARAVAALEAHGNYGEEFGAVVFDLRDSRAELSALKADPVALCNLLNAHMYPCAKGHAPELLALWPCWRCAVEADRRALVERAVRAGFDCGGIEWSEGMGQRIAARVIAEHNAEGGPKVAQ